MCGGIRGQSVGSQQGSICNSSWPPLQFKLTYPPQLLTLGFIGHVPY